jgi:hypothetical protein
MTASAANAQAVKPLLQLRTSVTYHIHGSQYADRYLFIAADGNATQQIVTGDPASAIGWMLEEKTGHASAAQLQALQSALSEARIGIQAGGCSIGSSLLSTGDAELTWYGQRYRKNKLDLRIGEATCPARLQQLFFASETFSEDVLHQNARF